MNQQSQNNDINDNDTSSINLLNKITLSKKSQSKLTLLKQLHSNLDTDDEIILDDYYCSLHKEIIINGRLRICVKHLWFYANIFGIETSVVFKWSDIISITRQKSALIIPNAIQILTANDKMFLSSFVSRDKTYLLLHQLWHFSLNNKEAVLPDRLHKIMLESKLSSTNSNKNDNSIDSKSHDNILSAINNNTIIDNSQSCPNNIMCVDQLKCNTNDKNSIKNSNKNSKIKRYLSTFQTVESENKTCIKTENQQLSAEFSDSNTSHQSNIYMSRSSLKMGLNIFKRHKKAKKLKKSNTTTDAHLKTCDNDDDDDDDDGDEASIPDTTTDCSSTNASNTTNSSSGGGGGAISSVSSDYLSSNTNIANNNNNENENSDNNNNNNNNNNDNNDDNINNNSNNIDDDPTNPILLNDDTLATSDNEDQAECDCSYLSNHITQELLDINYKTLFDEILSPSSEVNQEFIKTKKLSKFQSEDIAGINKNEFIRKTTYSIPLQWCGKSIDTIAIYNITIKKGHIKVFCESTAKGMPYGNAFLTHVHYCIKSLGDKCSVINVSFSIKYTQNVWAVTRKIIDKEVKYNVNEFILLILQIVKTKINKLPPKSDSLPIIKNIDDTNIITKNQSSTDNISSIPTTTKITNIDIVTNTADINSIKNTNIDNGASISMSMYSTQFIDNLKNQSPSIDTIFGCIGKNINILLHNINILHFISFLILLYLMFIYNTINDMNSDFKRFVTFYIENNQQIISNNISINDPNV